MGTFQIAQPPDMPIPWEIRQGWVGVELPFLASGQWDALLGTSHDGALGDLAATLAVTAIDILSQHGARDSKDVAAWMRDHTQLYQPEALMVFQSPIWKPAQQGDDWSIQLRHGRWGPNGYICMGCQGDDRHLHRCHNDPPSTINPDGIACACVGCALFNSMRTLIGSADDLEQADREGDLLAPCLLLDFNKDASATVELKEGQDVRAAVQRMLDEGTEIITVHDPIPAS